MTLSRGVKQNEVKYQGQWLTSIGAVYVTGMKPLRSGLFRIGGVAEMVQRVENISALGFNS